MSQLIFAWWRLHIEMSTSFVHGRSCFPSILRTHCLPWVPVSHQCMPSCRISSVTEMTKCWKQMGTPGTVRLPWTNIIFEELFSTICAWRAEHQFCMLFLEKERERDEATTSSISLDNIGYIMTSVGFCGILSQSRERNESPRHRQVPSRANWHQTRDDLLGYLVDYWAWYPAGHRWRLQSHRCWHSGDARYSCDAHRLREGLP